MSLTISCVQCQRQIKIKRITRKFCCAACEAKHRRARVKAEAATPTAAGNPEVLILEHKQPVIEHRLNADCGLSDTPQTR